MTSYLSANSWIPAVPPLHFSLHFILLASLNPLPKLQRPLGNLAPPPGSLLPTRGTGGPRLPQDRQQVGGLVAGKGQLQTLETSARLTGVLSARRNWTQKQKPWVLVLFPPFTCYVTSDRWQFLLGPMQDEVSVVRARWPSGSWGRRGCIRCSRGRLTRCVYHFTRDGKQRYRLVSHGTSGQPSPERGETFQFRLLPALRVPGAVPIT